MDAAVRSALGTDRRVDITTKGRRSGTPRRIEIWMFQVGGRIYVTGLPGPRGWYANVLAHPDMTLHIKESATADLPAVARPVVEADERRAVLTEILGTIERADALDDWVRDAPLIEVEIAGA